MIQLTRLNKQPLIVNSDLIQFVENAPDTVITLVSGEKIVVLETAEEVVQRIVEFRQRILAGWAPSNLSAMPPLRTIPKPIKDQKDQEETS